MFFWGKYEKGGRKWVGNEKEKETKGMGSLDLKYKINSKR
jgi:hypothetical protein